MKTTECDVCHRQIRNTNFSRHRAVCSLKTKKVRGIDFDPNRGYALGTRSAWNKGLTKTDERVKKFADAISANRQGKPGHKHTEATKKKLSIALSGNNHGGKCSWFKVDGVNVQGTWERDFALKLNELGIRWQKRMPPLLYMMNGKVRHYTPDFYLPDFNVYIELKGYWWGNDRDKMDHVLNQHADKKIVIVEKQLYEKVMHGELVW